MTFDEFKTEVESQPIKIRNKEVTVKIKNIKEDEQGRGTLSTFQIGYKDKSVDIEFFYDIREDQEERVAYALIRAACEGEFGI